MNLVKASEGGMIEEPVTLPNLIRNAPEPFLIERRHRPASFFACTGCEHCEER